MSEIVLEVERIGVRGDGVAHLGGARVFLPFTLPGDRVRARLEGGRTEILAFEHRAPRAEPRCPHFGACGGCALQHLPDELYAASKLSWLVEAFAHQGIRDAPILPLRRLAPATRRRARFSLDAKGNVGFMARASHRIVALEQCAVLHPRLVALAAPLRRLAPRILPQGGEGAATATLCETGIDLLLDLADRPDLARLETLAAFSREEDLARLAWRTRDEAPTLVAQHRQPSARFGGVAVDLPHDAFLQASVEADDALIAAVTASAAGAKHVVDLFAGIGTFTFPLAAASRVHAVERDEGALAALASAARSLGGRVTAEPRDLVRRPLLPAELVRFDAAVFDPPRAGAPAQAKALASSAVPLVIAVSCNPATFARDARVLLDGGYGLLAVAPLDSFLWSPHLELVASFRRR